MSTQELLTVVVPAFNEAAVLQSFQQRLLTVLDTLDMSCEVLYVDDGSSDDSWAMMEAFAREDTRVGALRLSRNFGKEAALSAGLDQVDECCDAVIVIDADLQDPPELIPDLVAQWRQGHDVVYAVR
ncbi:MAG: glycosyltransferase family 2 protein, partial [Rhodanobacteraceae bacterium]